ncbi:MAG: Gfo/Idh/MocA family oxidoreductase [Candidatus Kapabacteria bacterium]|jgi:predicted dehydrogenase|nr:Gfo/Idh/MocA family oxidoreductase [Candidatus Kapabacteria bacterium]
MTQPLRIAVVGTGHLGSIHAKLIGTHGDAVLAAVVDPDAERGPAIAATYETPWHASMDTLTDVDAVIIASPTTTHHAMAIQAMDRGWHCFIEKPVTATEDEAQDLERRADASRLVVQVGHVERFNPAVRAIAGMNVAPLFIEAHRLAPFKPRAIDVSVIHDLMIHDIDLLLWLTGSPVVGIHATGVSVLTPTIDICNARLEFANGCVANITASRISAKPMRKLRLFQGSGYLSLDLGAPSVELYRLIEASDLEPSHQTPLGSVSTRFGDRMIVHDLPPVEPGNAIADEQRSFIDSIRKGTNAAVSVHDGAEAVRIAAAIERQIAPQP